MIDKKNENISKNPRILIFGRKISIEGLAVSYTTISFFLIFFLSTDMGGRPVCHSRFFFLG